MKDLSRVAKVYILLTIILGAVIYGWQFAYLSDIPIMPLLALSAIAATAHILKVEGATSRSSFQISLLVYGFAISWLGLPAVLTVILVAHLLEWAWHKYPWFIQVFNISAFAISAAIAGFIMQGINQNLETITIENILRVLIAMGAFTFANHLMVGLVIKMARGESLSQSGVFGSLTLMIDFSLLCLGAATAILWQINFFAAILTLIPLYLVYSTLKIPALQRQTEIDPKTKLFNARYFAQALRKELSRADRFGRPVTVVLGDLDLLRNINNTYGHLAGDVVLIGIAEVLKNAFRDYDIVARFGGEEYAILLPETTPEQALTRIDNVRAAIESAEFEVSTSAVPIKATMSFGIAGREDIAQTADEIVHNADVALYRAKLGGRNCTCLYSAEGLEEIFGPAESAETGTVQIPLKLRVENAQFEFQPNPLRENYQAKKVNQTTKPLQQNKSVPDWKSKVMVGGMVFAALGLTALISRSPQLVDWVGLLSFALLVLLAEGLSIDLYIKDTSIPSSVAPLIAGAFLFGPLGVVVLSFVLAVTAMIKYRSPWRRFLFNLSNHMIGSALCVGLVQLTRTPLSSQPIIVQLSLVIFSAEMIYLISTILISEFMSLSIRQSTLGLWKDRFSWLWPYYFALGVGAYALMIGYVNAGIIGLVAFFVPLLVLRISQAQHIQYTKSSYNKFRKDSIAIREKAHEISNLNEELLLSLANVIDLRDPYVLGHSQHVARYAVVIAEELGVPPANIELIRKASLLHDIGKPSIPEAILFKVDGLTNQEFDDIKKHSVLSAEIIRNCQSLQPLVPIIRHHHERYDGTGYPDGLKGYEIPLEARIISLADALEAMASDRPYRKALSWAEILSEIQAHTGTQFDPVVVKAFTNAAGTHGESFLVNSSRASQTFQSVFIESSLPIHSLQLPKTGPRK